MMFSKGYAPFDPVCRRAVETILDHYAAGPAR
jgi:hypothetical protein